MYKQDPQRKIIFNITITGGAVFAFAKSLLFDFLDGKKVPEGAMNDIYNALNWDVIWGTVGYIFLCILIACNWDWLISQWTKKDREIKRLLRKEYNMPIREALSHVQNHYEKKGIKAPTNMRYMEAFIHEVKNKNIPIRAISERDGCMEYVDPSLFERGGRFIRMKEVHTDIAIYNKDNDLLYSVPLVPSLDVYNMWPLDGGWMAA
jgi:hypothetical protein